ncbi:ALG-2 interacting protein x [Penaeus vannamei]|uniref:ALG-2 interacting protein x n=1 Tax=Penaeus vannamei TaxID=6689 RepID=A0A423SBB5_PENVA|nr:ALG-2 interacting protein x [Penaeus vannamei]
MPPLPQTNRGASRPPTLHRHTSIPVTAFISLSRVRMRPSHRSHGTAERNLINTLNRPRHPSNRTTRIQDRAYGRSPATTDALTVHDLGVAAATLIQTFLLTLAWYYDQIVALESKIPASEIQIPFKWKDAFDKGSIFGGRISLTVSSLSYEKVCVLFNIAAMQSQCAAKNADSEEEMKLSASSSRKKGNQINPCLFGLPECFRNLLAPEDGRAQEVITVHAIRGRKKDAIIAKLCAQCEDMYGETLKLFQRESIKQLWDREWIPRISGKQAGYAGLAEYHQSRVCNNDKSVGEEIARLNKGLEMFKAAQARSGDLTMFADNLGRAKNCLDEAVKDNDFIYHERVPDVKSLSAIAKAALAKPTPCQRDSAPPSPTCLRLSFLSRCSRPLWPMTPASRSWCPQRLASSGRAHSC